MKKKTVKNRNFVQMHVAEFNKPAVFTDRKKAQKAGYQKHKKGFEGYEKSSPYGGDFFCLKFSISGLKMAFVVDFKLDTAVFWRDFRFI